MSDIQHLDAHGQEAHHHHDDTDMTVLGFWTYIMSDLILFSSLFVAFAVLMTHSAQGPTAPEVFGDTLGFVMVETFLLLVSSFTFGMAMLAQHKQKKSQVLSWLALTFVLGAGFIGMEVYEFNHLIHIGHGPTVSAFLSSYFSLVGTHGLHVTAGLIWMLVLSYQISTQGLTLPNMRRLACLSIFWHFLDIVWICVFSVVYLLGAIG